MPPSPPVSCPSCLPTDVGLHECGSVDAPAEARGEHQVPTLSVSALFLGTESPTGPRAGLAASKLHCLPLILSPTVSRLQLLAWSRQRSIFRRMLYIQTQVLIPVQKSLLATEPSLWHQDTLSHTW